MGRRPFTLIFPYYENPTMLDMQLMRLSIMPAEVREALHLIVVDDGSPKSPLGEFTAACMRGLGLASVQLFRITVDVRWNWIAARNLAVSQASTEWVLMTDIDHIVPEATMRRIQEVKLSDRNVYRFSRVDVPDLTPYKPHPNSWLMTRAMFDKIGGYDERFSGYYGTDGEFRDRVTAACREVVLLDQALWRVPREVVADASTTAYQRKQPEDREGVTRIRREIAQSPTPHRGTFPWVRVV
jgi:hypothetical protein